MAILSQAHVCSDPWRWISVCCMVFAITVLLNSLKSTCKAIFLLCIALVTSIPRVQSGTPDGFFRPWKVCRLFNMCQPSIGTPWWQWSLSAGWGSQRTWQGVKGAGLSLSVWLNSCEMWWGKEKSSSPWWPHMITSRTYCKVSKTLVPPEVCGVQGLMVQSCIWSRRVVLMFVWLVE